MFPSVLKPIKNRAFPSLTGHPAYVMVTIRGKGGLFAPRFHKDKAKLVHDGGQMLQEHIAHGGGTEKASGW